VVGRTGAYCGAMKTSGFFPNFRLFEPNRAHKSGRPLKRAESPSSRKTNEMKPTGAWARSRGTSASGVEKGPCGS